MKNKVTIPIAMRPQDLLRDVGAGMAAAEYSGLPKVGPGHAAITKRQMETLITGVMDAGRVTVLAMLHGHN